jgi:hypothetical protein
MFAEQVQMHWKNSQSKVRYPMFCLELLMSIVVAFQEPIRLAFPQVLALLRDHDWNVCRVGADALEKLSEQGKISNVLVWEC